MSKLNKIDVDADFIVVDVRQEDIDNGVRCWASGCAIARALQRDGYEKPCVSPWLAFINRGEYFPDAAAIKFMREFDSGGEVQPGRFVFSKR